MPRCCRLKRTSSASNRSVSGPHRLDRGLRNGSPQSPVMLPSILHPASLVSMSALKCDVIDTISLQGHHDIVMQSELSTGRMDARVGSRFCGF